MFDPRSLLIIAIIALGIILPLLLRQQNIVAGPWLRSLALAIIVLASTIAAIVSYALFRTDMGTIFVRAFLVDGISIYVLNNAPAALVDKGSK